MNIGDEVNRNKFRHPHSPTYLEDTGNLTFIVVIALSIEQGAPLAATLGDVSNSLQAEIGPEIENELPGRALRTAMPMVLGMGVALAVAGIAALDAAPSSTCASMAAKPPAGSEPSGGCAAYSIGHAGISPSISSIRRMVSFRATTIFW